MTQETIELHEEIATLKGVNIILLEALINLRAQVILKRRKSYISLKQSEQAIKFAKEV